MQWLAIALGGAAGAVVRFATVGWMNTLLGKQMPWGTLSVNVVGSFLAGVLVAVLVGKTNQSSAIQSLLVVGFLGSFTTFSAFSIDNLQLIQAGDYGKAAVYVSLSVLACLGAAFLGLRMAGGWVD